jgi:hypothetical protein
MMKQRSIILTLAACLSCPGFALAEEREKPVTADEATTVKSSKSNSSERAGTSGSASGDRGTVKSSKSNSSERTTVNSGKSNADN